ncbi:RING finger protein B [Biomphalaria pfeifferi]|uniref:RING finger protein B n=1 Tax=Biomphalaria pfeifferi TaxID=112525 RepID=A0AAD8FIG6_BIOPF|nr:RING finger protein B [Biomphalaria pfeifferi]
MNSSLRSAMPRQTTSYKARMRSFNLLSNGRRGQRKLFENLAKDGFRYSSSKSEIVCDFCGSREDLEKLTSENIIPHGCNERKDGVLKYKERDKIENNTDREVEFTPRDNDLSGLKHEHRDACIQGVSHLNSANNESEVGESTETNVFRDVKTKSNQVKDTDDIDGMESFACEQTILIDEECKAIDENDQIESVENEQTLLTFDLEQIKKCLSQWNSSDTNISLSGSKESSSDEEIQLSSSTTNNRTSDSDNKRETQITDQPDNGTLTELMYNSDSRKQVENTCKGENQSLNSNNGEAIGVKSALPNRELPRFLYKNIFTTEDKRTKQSKRINVNQLYELLNVVRKENECLQLKMKCKQCKEKPLQELFLPCKHVFACRECAAKIDQCPSCGKKVLATINIYFA